MIAGCMATTPAKVWNRLPLLSSLENVKIKTLFKLTFPDFLPRGPHRSRGLDNKMLRSLVKDAQILVRGPLNVWEKLDFHEEGCERRLVAGLPRGGHCERSQGRALPAQAAPLHPPPIPARGCVTPGDPRLPAVAAGWEAGYSPEQLNISHSRGPQKIAANAESSSRTASAISARPEAASAATGSRAAHGHLGAPRPHSRPGGAWGGWGRVCGRGKCLEAPPRAKGLHSSFFPYCFPELRDL